jgi:hypothetical protein
METIMATLLLSLLAVAALGAGIAFGRAPLKPGCSGNDCSGACGNCRPGKRRSAP